MPSPSIGCCGRPTANLEALVYVADLHPRSTRAGQRARARLALALVERRGIAQNNPTIVAKARRGLAMLGGLGTTASDQARRDAVQAAIGTARSGRERRDPSGRVIDALQIRHDARIGRDVETALGLLTGATALVEAVIRGEASREVANAAAAGREPNYTLADTAKVLAWMRWVFGGSFPADVAENDLRLFGTIYNVALPIAQGALTALRISASTNPTTRDALTALDAYLAALGRTVTAAVAALPPPTTPASASPPTDAPPPGVPAWRWASMTQEARDALKRSLRVNPNDIQVTPTKSSTVALALPAALVLWYLFK